MSDLRQAFVRSCAVTPLQARIGHDIGDVCDRLFAGMEPRKDPLQPIFRDHNCWRCRNGEKPCAEGNYNCCSYPHARND